MKLNILHTEIRNSAGGQARRVLEDLKAIRVMGHRPFLACKTNAWLYNAAKEENIPVFPISFRNALDPISFFKLFSIVKKHHIDIVHTHSSEDSYITMAVSTMIPIKTVRTRHMDFTKPPGFIYRTFDHLITTGEKVRRTLIDSGIDSKNITSIPSYPNPHHFILDNNMRIQYRNKYQITDRIVIGTMTGLNPKKRILRLLPIIQDISVKHPEIILLIAGQKQSNQNEIFKKTLTSLSLKNHVIHVGYVDPKNFLQAVDIYVCPSGTEGIPQSIMQAMMLGKPIVTSNVGSIKDLNIDENIHLVEKNDFFSFKKNLEKLIINETKRRIEGNKNRSIALEYFNFDILTQKLKKIYEGLFE